MKEIYDDSETGGVSIGEKIRTLRTEKNMTQQKLAEGICDACTISRIENGQFIPSKPLLGKLLQRLEAKNREFWFQFDEKTAMEEQKIENIIQMLEQEDLKSGDRWICALEDLKKASGERAGHLMELINLIGMEESKSMHCLVPDRCGYRLEENILYGYGGESALWDTLNEQAKFVIRIRRSEEEIDYHRYVERTCDQMIEMSEKGEGTDCDMDRLFHCVKGVSLIRQERPKEGAALFFALRNEIEKGHDLYRMNDRRIAVCDINIAIALLLQHRYTEAVDYLEHARKVLENGSISWKLLLRLLHVEIIVSILQKDPKEKALRYIKDAQVLCRIRSGGREDVAKMTLLDEMSTGLLLYVL